MPPTPATKWLVPWNPGQRVPGLLWKLALKRNRLDREQRLPPLECRADRLRLDLSHLDQYRSITSSPENSFVPLLYPHVVFGSAHLALVSHPAFPLRVFGLLHLRNHIVRYQDFDPHEPLDLHCQLSGQRVTEKGLEFDLRSEIAIDGRVVWRSVSTLFKRGNFGSPDPPSSLAGLFPKQPQLQPIADFDVPMDIGRQYARVSGDYNPIHVSTWMAKLFGFRTTIAHGMWTAARALSCGFDLSRAPIRLDVVFKGPVYTGSHVNVVRTGDHWELFCADNPKPVVQGVLRSTHADDSLG